MSDESLPDWEFDPAPTAAHDARVREALLGWAQGSAAVMLDVVRDVMADGNVAGLAMAFARVYMADMDGAAGRDLTIARLEANIDLDHVAAAVDLREAQQ